MPFIHDDALDQTLSYIQTNTENLRICSSEPAAFASVAAATLGTKAAPSIGAPANRTPNGRRVTVAAITDGSVTANGTASHWVLTDDSASKILASGALAATQVVTSGNTFTLAAFDIGVPDAV